LRIEDLGFGEKRLSPCPKWLWATLNEYFLTMCGFSVHFAHLKLLQNVQNVHVQQWSMETGGDLSLYPAYKHITNLIFNIDIDQIRHSAYLLTCC